MPNANSKQAPLSRAPICKPLAVNFKISTEMIEPIINRNHFIAKLDEFISSAPSLITSSLQRSFFMGQRDGNTSSSSERLLISEVAIEECNLKNITFDYIHFKSCVFKKFSAEELKAHDCVFEDCEFLKTDIRASVFFLCDFINCSITKSRWAYVQLSDSTFTNTAFINCYELLEFYFGGCYFDNLKFDNCQLGHCRFPPIVYGKENIHLTFLRSTLHTCSFINNNLQKSEFLNCKLAQCVFSNCLLSRKTFKENTSSINEEFCSIDLQSIKASEAIDEIDLRNIFGIHNSDIKEYVSELTTRIIFQSIFISYSFKDRHLALKLNEELRLLGIFTFLWEKDAPGGTPLKKIMRDKIHKLDRILFISSSNSLRSAACQFELSEARKKQEKIWKNVFYPIHIDQYLFEVEKEDIRPTHLVEEYWANIVALREINSLDFSEFCLEVNDIIKFRENVRSIVKGLEK